ncbi:hypothetical protein [Sphingobacterium nematocida]|uniref:hypothetical protein n=1 Tax=Sphingobacterium nematocida TaxID=1513896 RepID=UPI001FE3D718|nr:hypothetical protein [Sphingobacterium nematocida]
MKSVHATATTIEAIGTSSGITATPEIREIAEATTSSTLAKRNPFYPISLISIKKNW